MNNEGSASQITSRGEVKPRNNKKHNSEKSERNTKQKTARERERLEADVCRNSCVSPITRSMSFCYSMTFRRWAIASRTLPCCTITSWCQTRHTQQQPKKRQERTAKKN